MPLSEQLGKDLPKTLPLPQVLACTCFLGILVTYAEPAITALRPLARLVDPKVAPYLYLAINVKQELLVFVIGLGVGVAALLGTLRFVNGWSLKPLIYGSMVPCILLAMYMHWGDPDLRPILGLAWDCGAVTTGPVTVPVLLALGIGVMKTQNEVKDKAAREEARREGREYEKVVADNALEGFGIVTLASLMPVLGIEIFAISLKMMYTKEQIQEMKIDDIDPNSLFERSPYKEAYFAARAICPLIVALVFLVMFVLKLPLPDFTYYLEEKEEENEEDADAKSEDDDGKSVEMKEMPQKQYEKKAKSKCVVIGEHIGWPHTGPGVCAVCVENGKYVGDEGRTSTSEVEMEVVAGEVAIKVSESNKNGGVKFEKKAKKVDSDDESEDDTSRKPTKKAESSGGGMMILVCGSFQALAGMVMFNLGLNFGFSSLGDQMGTLLPAAFMKTPQEEASPFYSWTTGVGICLGTMFALGVLATRAEPALNVLGLTVEQLTKGSFSKSMLINAVCFGVATGMAFGATKILFGVELIKFLIVKYAVAVTLTYYISEDFVNIAWDSAGVTTGPVTVPFVLAVGVGCSKAVQAAEGFGILACASVWPIVSVMSMEAIRRLREWNDGKKDGTAHVQMK
jgi:uncharacterized membrane protein YvlD (DUF360 family)